VKDLKFGWQGSSAFPSCHQGALPFSAPHSLIEVHQRLRAMEEDAEQATTTTIADVCATWTAPPPCPADCCGLLQMLCACIKLLMMLFGRAFGHMTSVTSICFLLHEMVSIYERMTKIHVAHLLWAIFLDAQDF
jgi:hypothetical protein